MLFTDKKHGNFAKDPAVVQFRGRYILYYSIRDPETEKFGIGIAVSEDMESWEDAGELPLTQECEKNGIAAPGAIVLDGRVHLFYQTYGNMRRDAICHAVSDDGVSFEKDETNPVFRPSETWCCGRAIDADVCLFGGKLMLYFATRDHELRTQKVGVAAAELDSGFSRGSFREAHMGAVLTPELKWEVECIEAPATLVRNGKIYMFYGGAYNCSPQQIGCAVSEDGVLFERLFTEPFLPNGGAGDWNRDESGHPYAFVNDEGRTVLFYQGTRDMGRTWYLSRLELDFDGDKPVKK